jgi:diguanylate cyclase (GGDEF)-like protein
MLELRNWYREKLATRINALEGLRMGLTSRSREAILSARRLAHSLRGSGATYGFPRITEAARDLEESGDRGLAARLDALLSALREAAGGGRTEQTGILVVEDNPDQACFLQTLLAAPDRRIQIASTGAQALASLEDHDISLILLDLVLPDVDGRDLLLRLRERPATAGIPVIVVTVKGAEVAKAECLALGADAYLEKPVNPEALAAAVEAHLRNLPEGPASRRDPLTGLPNRAVFREAFPRLQRAAELPESPLALAVLDLDDFAAVNEAFGRECGDQVLRAAAAVVARAFRTSDLMARWTGNTFAVLFPGTNEAGAVRALEKARASLREERFDTGEGHKVCMTFSAGVAEVAPQGSFEDVMALVDRRLFRAKAEGRDRIVSSADPGPAPRVRIMVVEDDELIAVMIKHHLAKAGFEVLHYPDGLEALSKVLEEAPSLILSDVRMPRMDGFEFLQRLRAVPSLARLPVMMLSSMGGEEDLVKGFSLGADDYMLKPFSPMELVARLRRLLKKR